MIYLSAENISKSYDEKVLLENLSFGIDQGQKIALIGVNGCGKSTLLRIMAGIETPDSGTISIRRGTKISYLSQEPHLPPHKTVAEVVFSSDQPELRLIKEYEMLLTEVGKHPEKQAELDEVMTQIEAMDAWSYEQKIHEVLSKLEVNFLDLPIGVLSGGQQKRVAMAQALISEPDLMIMDEPTNHLDLASIEWLEKFLSTSKQSILLVTHDRYFLESVTDEIFELEQGNLYRYKGDYAYFLEKKDEREQNKLIETSRAQSLFRTELEWLRRSPKARTSKSKSRIDAAHELGEKASYRQETQEVSLQVKGRRIGGKVLEIKHLQKAYGDLKILNSFTYTFNRHDRIGIVGPNGVGKTTFLRMITGEEEPDSGKIRMGETIVYGYYKQSGFGFKDNARVIEVVTEAAETVEISKSQSLSAAQLLEHFLFPRSTHYKMVDTLSGGEKRRLHLLRILMTNPNFLILDEPTNDLDLITLRKLEEFLADFQGCLVVVTHDRFFMDRLVDHMFVFEGNGEVRDYPGSYSQYREWKEGQDKSLQDKAKEEKTPSPESVIPKEKPKTERKRKLSFNEQRELDRLDSEVEKLEARKQEVTTLMNEGGADYTKLASLAEELKKITADLEIKSDRWLELMEIAEG
ncbi:MAG: ABC-F family ATP-binding cassette domain-containing protein [Bacteroidia bacterium]|nr:ABC-F family ATP-binding cassette domain-containing protein [Bacteroidia bacterium]